MTAAAVEREQAEAGPGVLQRGRGIMALLVAPLGPALGAAVVAQGALRLLRLVALG